MIRARAWRNGVIEASELEPGLISEYLAEPDTVVWMDLVSPTPEDLDVISDELALHPLALEDAFHPGQRPKVEKYENHMFVVLYAVAIRSGSLITSEIDIFLGERYLITVRKDPEWSAETFLIRWETAEGFLKHGIAAHLHGLIDAVVDEYLLIADLLRGRLQAIDDKVLDYDSKEGYLAEVQGLRKDLGHFRRATEPMRELMDDLRGPEFLTLPGEVDPYFEDLRDHMTRVADSADTMQEMLTSAINLHLSAASHRLNDIVRRVTGWGAIIGVATTIAGIYGMNFRLFPSGENPYSFLIANSLITVSAAGLYIYFRRRDWI